MRIFSTRRNLVDVDDVFDWWLTLNVVALFFPESSHDLMLLSHSFLARGTGIFVSVDSTSLSFDGIAYLRGPIGDLYIVTCYTAQTWNDRILWQD